MNDSNSDIDRTVGQDGDIDAFPADVVDAVISAFEETIGHLVGDREVYFHAPSGDDRDHVIGHFSFNYPEIPVTGADGGIAWHPTYRTRETVEEALFETLPDDVEFEPKNSDTHTVYRV